MPKTDNYAKLVNAIDKNPKLLEELLSNESGAITRGASPTRGDNVILRSVLGNNTNSTELNNMSRKLSDNPVVQLYMSSAGSLDAKDLLGYVGGLEGKNMTRNSNQAVRALFDGRLDLKEIMIIIVLMKLFKRKNANTYNNSAIGLLGTLLGFNTQPVNNTGLLGTLFGNNYNSYSGGLFGNTYSNGLFTNQYNNSGLGSFLGLYPNNYQNNYNNNQLQNLLNFVNGNYNNNPQYHSLYNILNNSAPHYVNNNGVISASGLFNILNQMMGY